jgi:hypothetical protein
MGCCDMPTLRPVPPHRECYLCGINTQACPRPLDPSLAALLLAFVWKAWSSARLEGPRPLSRPGIGNENQDASSSLPAAFAASCASQTSSAVSRRTAPLGGRGGGAGSTPGASRLCRLCPASHRVASTRARRGPRRESAARAERRRGQLGFGQPDRSLQRQDTDAIGAAGCAAVAQIFVRVQSFGRT